VTKEELYSEIGHGEKIADFQGKRNSGPSGLVLASNMCTVQSVMLRGWNKSPDGVGELELVYLQF